MNFCNTRRDPQVQDRRRRVYLDAGASDGQPDTLARLSGDRERGHARCGGKQPADCLWQFQGRLSDRRTQRNQYPARSLFEQTLCQFLRHQAAGRGGFKFGSDQAAEDRGELTSPAGEVGKLMSQAN